MGFVMQANNGGGGGGGEQPPAGNSPAVLVALVDLGTQHEEFKGEAKWVPQVLLVWELPTRKRKDGKSHVMSAVVKQSLHEKATLRKWVQAMTSAKIADGANFDIATLLGRPCMLGIVHNERGYAKVDAVGDFPDMGVPPPAATLPKVAVSLEEFQAGRAVLPEWLPWQWSRAVGRRVSVPDCIRLCREVAGDGAGRAPAAAAAANDLPPF